MGYDLSPIAETVDEPLLQRMGLVTEFSIEHGRIRLRGLTGRIVGDQQNGLDVSRTDRLRGHLDLRMSRANLQTFGLMENVRCTSILSALEFANWKLAAKSLQSGVLTAISHLTCAVTIFAPTILIGAGDPERPYC